MANDSYHTREYYKQHRAMIVNGSPRALILICVDVSISMNEWWIEDSAAEKTTGRKFSDGHYVHTFSRETLYDGSARYQKIKKLNDVLKTLLNDFKHDVNLRDKVAVSIVSYSKYAKVVNDFLDCREIDIDACECKVDDKETMMGEGLRMALYQLDEMENDMKEAGNDAYTPILIFLTDGVPSDDPRREFEEIRTRVEKRDLHIFPLGIGEGADMMRLREMYPVGMVPQGFSEKYRMVEPESYDKIFMQIKSYVKKKNDILVSEGNSAQSAPAIETVGVMNNQMGTVLDDEDYRYLL